MKVWRLYVDGEVVGTYGDGPAARTMALMAMGEWFSCGYTCLLYTSDAADD